MNSKPTNNMDQTVIDKRLLDYKTNGLDEIKELYRKELNYRVHSLMDGSWFSLDRKGLVHAVAFDVVDTRSSVDVMSLAHDGRVLLVDGKTRALLNSDPVLLTRVLRHNLDMVLVEYGNDLWSFTVGHFPES